MRATSLIVRSVLSVLSVLVLGGCKVPEDEPKPGRPAPVSEQFQALAPAPGRVVSAQGRISVPEPRGPGWECVEERHGEAEAAAVALRCRRENPREFLFLAAKTHRQPVDQRTDARLLLMTLYRADNEGFFRAVEYLRDGPVELAGSGGWEAELRAEHEQLGEIHKRERVAILGDRIYAVSAEGKPELWARHLDVIEEWFAGVEFAR
ncbi:MAG: hypothetical protein R6X02_29345 [Enhygromyxa sp.]